MYSFLQVGDIRFLYLVLEFGPRYEVLEWASDVLDEYSDLPCMLLTRCYYNTDGTKSTYNAQRAWGDFKGANEGKDIRDKLVSKHDNVVMVRCGQATKKSVIS